MTAPGMPTPGEVARLSPLVRRLTQHNPSLFTGIGTNTYLVGRDELFILDPGPDDRGHFERILEAVGDARVLGIIPTHHHHDHWPLAPVLARHFEAPTMGYAAYGGYEPETLVQDGEVLASKELELTAVHTPGHAPDHLCYVLDGEESLFSGDHVMGWSTSVIAPPAGNLNDFMSSLEKLRTVRHRRMYPAHGLPIDAPQERIDELYEHRLERTREALEALASGLSDIPAMVERIYADVDKRLHTAAGWSLLAHLLALVEDGRVRVTEEAENPLQSRYALAGQLDS